MAAVSVPDLSGNTAGVTYGDPKTSTEDNVNIGKITTTDALPVSVDISDAITTTPAPLPASADRSGTATTTSGGLSVAANSARKFLVGQNISAVSIGFNEQGGTAVIGTAGTYTVAPGQAFSISTNKLVNFICASGTAAVTMTEG